MSKVLFLRGCIGLSMTLWLFASQAFAQAGGAGAGSTGAGTTPPGNTGGGNTGGNTGGTTNPGRTPSVGQYPQTQQQTPQQTEIPRPVFISGKVLMDDGSPPPSQVVIERVCNGQVRPEAYTSSKGHFSFALGQNNAMMADASIGGMGASSMDRIPSGMNSGAMGQTGARLMGCELRASLAGFRSDVIDLSQRRDLDTSEVGVIVLHRMAKVDGFTFSGTSTFAPKDAKKAYDKGHDAAKRNKLADAELSLQKAVDLYPKYAVAWYELGMVYQQQKKLDEAKKAYEESLKADGKFVSPYAQLTKLAAVGKNWEQTLEYSDKLLKLNPYFSPEIYFYNAVANLNLKNLDAAEEHAREGLKMDPQNRNPRMNQVLGVVLAQKQDYSGAAASMKSYLKLAPDAPDSENVKLQIQALERELAPAEASSKKPE